MDIKIEVKHEVPLSEVPAETEREDFAMKLDSLSNKEIKTDIKEEIVESNFCQQNDNLFSYEDCVKEDNEVNKDWELDTETEIKEELHYLDVTSVDGVTKDEMPESFPSTESIRFYRKELSTELSSDELGRNSGFNIREDSLECKAARKYRNEEIHVAEISLVKKNVFTEQYGVEEMDNKSYCFKHNNLTQQNNTQEQHFSNKKYSYKSVSVTDSGTSEKIFTSASRSNRTMYIDKMVHKCSVCDKNFTDSAQLKRHKLVHAGIKPYKCDICGKCFSQLSNLKRHKLIHEGFKPHKCGTCGKSFTDLSLLKRHELFHKDIKAYKCEACGKCFVELSNLKRHKLSHDGIKPHCCDACGKCFTHLSQLKRHKLIHIGLKPHTCDICGKCFAELSKMKVHKLIHEGIMSHICDICGKCFGQLSYLKKHKLTHEDIKPQRCDSCDKYFIDLFQLKRHKLSHEGVKPHKCDTCGKCFGQLSHLKRHKLIHKDIKLLHKYDSLGK